MTNKEKAKIISRVLNKIYPKVPIPLNYKNIFKYIYDKGFNGVLGMEHGNSLKGLEGELKLINSYKKVDNFK